MQILASGPGDAKSTGRSKNFQCTHGGTRTPNLRFRRPTPYPLGHAGTVVISVDASTMNYKITLRRPGIEPGSQEWESCMIPIHQRRHSVKMPTGDHMPKCCPKDFYECVLLKRTHTERSFIVIYTTARLAQSVEHETLNLRVVGSSPTLGATLLLLYSYNLDDMHRCPRHWYPGAVA